MRLDLGWGKKRHKDRMCKEAAENDDFQVFFIEVVWVGEEGDAE